MSGQQQPIYGGFPGWGSPFSYSPNAGPAYTRPQWPGSFPDGGGTAPPPGSGGLPTPPQFNWGGYGGNPFMRPPAYPGPQTPARPSWNPGVSTGPGGETRPVNGGFVPHWATPQPYTSFPQFTQPGNVNSVGPGGPYQPDSGTNQPNPGTTPPPTTTPPGNDLSVRPKIGMQQGQVVSDNFTNPDQGSAPPGLFNTLATGQGGGNYAPADINRYGPGSGGWGQFLNWYAQNNAMLNRQGPMYQPGGIFYGR